MRKLLLVGILVVLLLILAWAPWITREYAEEKVNAQFEDSWKNVADGCGMDCVGCGVTASNKMPFGYSVSYEYGCGLMILGQPNQEGTAYVNFLGMVSGIPAP